MSQQPDDESVSKKGTTANKEPSGFFEKKNQFFLFFYLWENIVSLFNYVVSFFTQEISIKNDNEQTLEEKQGQTLEEKQEKISIEKHLMNQLQQANLDQTQQMIIESIIKQKLGAITKASTNQYTSTDLFKYIIYQNKSPKEEYSRRVIKAFNDVLNDNIGAVAPLNDGQERLLKEVLHKNFDQIFAAELKEIHNKEEALEKKRKNAQEKASKITDLVSKKLFPSKHTTGLSATKEEQIAIKTEIENLTSKEKILVTNIQDGLAKIKLNKYVDLFKSDIEDAAPKSLKKILEKAQKKNIPLEPSIKNDIDKLITVRRQKIKYKNMDKKINSDKPQQRG